MATRTHTALVPWRRTGDRDLFRSAAHWAISLLPACAAPTRPGVDLSARAV